MSSPVSFSRRDVLKMGGALIVTFTSPLVVGADQSQVAGAAARSLNPSLVDSFLAIHADGSVSVYTGKVQLALAPQVLTEFAHVVTDPRRFSRPLEMDEAISRAELWWRAREVLQVFPDSVAVDTCLEWMRAHRLGRKRLLDTQLAATYDAAGIRSILSSNARDCAVFGVFTIIEL